MMKKIAILFSLFLLYQNLISQCTWDPSTEFITVQVGNTVGSSFRGNSVNWYTNSSIDSIQWDFDVSNSNGYEFTSVSIYDSVRSWVYSNTGTKIIAMRFVTASNCDTILYDTIDIVTNQPHQDATCGACNGSITFELHVAGGIYTTYAIANSSLGAVALNTNNQSSVTFSSICPGNEWFQHTYYSGDTISYTVSDPGLPSILFTPDDTALCNTDSILVSANITGGVAPYYFLWNDNNGSITQDTGLSSTFFSGATSAISLSVTDSVGCVNEDSTTVIHHTPPNITGSTTDESCSSCCDGTISLSVTGNNLLYYWSNGSNSSALSNLCPGYYSVTVYDSITNCNDSANFTINAYAQSCYFLSGTIDQGDDTRVYLIQENSGTLSAVDSTTTDATGLYMFSNVCNGTYYIKAALLSSHIYYTAFLPTYYDSAALWANATDVVVNNASNYSVDIEMLAGANSGGPGFIGGLISQGANRGEGDPVVGAQVIAYNSNGTVAAFDRTDAAGAYSLSNLALGAYEVYVDALNKTSYPHLVTLSEETPESPDRNFEIIGSIIKPIAPTGLNHVITGEINVFPNPTNGLILVHSGKVDLTSIYVFNLLGEHLMNWSSTHPSNNVELDLSHLPSGSYIIELNGENFTQHYSILRQ